MKIKNLRYSLAVMGLTMPLVLSGCSCSIEKSGKPETSIKITIKNEIEPIIDNESEFDFEEYNEEYNEGYNSSSKKLSRWIRFIGRIL